MSKIKFTAKVNQGKIEIPQEYQEAIQDAEIIEIVIHHKTKYSKKSTVNSLIKNPIEVPNFVPLTRDEAHER